MDYSHVTRETRGITSRDETARAPRRPETRKQLLKDTRKVNVWGHFDPRTERSLVERWVNGSSHRSTASESPMMMAACSHIIRGPLHWLRDSSSGRVRIPITQAHRQVRTERTETPPPEGKVPLRTTGVDTPTHRSEPIQARTEKPSSAQVKADHAPPSPRPPTHPEYPQYSISPSLRNLIHANLSAIKRRKDGAQGGGKLRSLDS